MTQNEKLEELEEEILAKEDEEPTQFEKQDEEEHSKFDPTWSQLKYIPNKRRFILLTSIISVLELAGFFLFSFVIKDANGNYLDDLGLFLLPPFAGALVAYFVSSKKEAVAVSAVNALSSILIYMAIYTPIGVYVLEDGFTLNVYYFLIPVLAIFLQVIIAFTIARMRVLYRNIGDSSIERESDEDMINELKRSRAERGLEDFEIQKQESDNEEN